MVEWWQPATAARLDRGLRRASRHDVESSLHMPGTPAGSPSGPHLLDKGGQVLELGLDVGALLLPLLALVNVQVLARHICEGLALEFLQRAGAAGSARRTG